MTINECSSDVTNVSHSKFLQRKCQFCKMWRYFCLWNLAKGLPGIHICLENWKYFRFSFILFQLQFGISNFPFTFWFPQFSRLHYRKFFVKDAHLDAVSRCIEVIFCYMMMEFFLEMFFFNRKLSRNSIATEQKSPIMTLQFDISIEAKTKSLFSFISTMMQSRQRRNSSPSHLIAKKKYLSVLQPSWATFPIHGRHRWMI